MCSLPKVKLCRLCLCNGGRLIDIFKENDALEFVVNDVIEDLLQLQVKRQDGFPWLICSSCLKKLTDFRFFKIRCLECKVTFESRFPESENPTRASLESDISRINRSSQACWVKVPTGYIVKQSIDGESQGEPSKDVSDGKTGGNTKDGTGEPQLRKRALENDESVDWSSIIKRTADEMGDYAYSAVQNWYVRNPKKSRRASPSTSSQQARKDALPKKAVETHPANKCRNEEDLFLLPSDTGEDQPKSGAGPSQNVGGVLEEATSEEEDGEVWLSGRKRQRAALQRWYWELERKRSKEKETEANGGESTTATVSAESVEVESPEEATRSQLEVGSSPGEGEWCGGMPKIVNVCCSTGPKPKAHARKAESSLLFGGKAFRWGGGDETRAIVDEGRGCAVDGAGVEGSSCAAAMDGDGDSMLNKGIIWPAGQRAYYTTIPCGESLAESGAATRKAKQLKLKKKTGRPRSRRGMRRRGGASFVAMDRGTGGGGRVVKKPKSTLLGVRGGGIARVPHESQTGTDPSTATNGETVEATKRPEFGLKDAETEVVVVVSRDKDKRLIRVPNRNKGGVTVNGKELTEVLKKAELGFQGTPGKVLVVVTREGVGASANGKGFIERVNRKAKVGLMGAGDGGRVVPSRENIGGGPARESRVFEGDAVSTDRREAVKGWNGAEFCLSDEKTIVTETLDNESDVCTHLSGTVNHESVDVVEGECFRSTGINTEGENELYGNNESGTDPSVVTAAGNERFVKGDALRSSIADDGDKVIRGCEEEKAGEVGNKITPLIYYIRKIPPRNKRGQFCRRVCNYFSSCRPVVKAEPEDVGGEGKGFSGAGDGNSEVGGEVGDKVGDEVGDKVGDEVVDEVMEYDEVEEKGRTVGLPQVNLGPHQHFQGVPPMAEASNG